MIYAVEIMDFKFVKIGYADNVEKRIAALQTGCPFKINLILAVQGTLLNEQALHYELSRAFARIKMPTPPNEWYPGRHPFFNFFLSELRYGFRNGFVYAQNHRRHDSKTGLLDPEPLYKWPTLSETNLASIGGGDEVKRPKNRKKAGLISRTEKHHAKDRKRKSAANAEAAAERVKALDLSTLSPEIRAMIGDPVV